MTAHRFVPWLSVTMFAAAQAASATQRGTADRLRDWLADPSHIVAAAASESFASDPLTAAAAKETRAALCKAFAEQVRREDGERFAHDEVSADGKTLKLLTRHIGTKPAAGWPMFISLHGGGGAPAEVNDSQWQNQIKLYDPPNAFVVAPRAPTDNWNLWHEAHIDPLIDRLIADAIALGEVDPDHIYLMGYSAGGDGVYQLAPRMADRFAAASMMAGHPNDAQPDGLRNLPFAIHVGALDSAYDRNQVAAEYGRKLDALQKTDADGYIHHVEIHAGRSHWMNREDRSALAWMTQYKRNPLPTKVVWRQDDVTHDRLYWLAVPAKSTAAGALVVASREGQVITIEKADHVDRLSILFCDAMLDLDQPVTVKFNGRTLFEGVAKRTLAVQSRTLAERGDPASVFDAKIVVDLRDARK